MGRFRFPFWRRNASQAAPPRQAEEGLDAVSRRNVAAYGDLQEALRQLLAARSNAELQVHEGLRRAWPPARGELPPRMRRALEGLRQQDRQADGAPQDGAPQDGQTGGDET